MKLYGNPLSPFARKCKVIALALDIALEDVTTHPAQDEGFRALNPLGKIPALLRDDGSVLFDSPVICEYLDHLGAGAFFPKGDDRWRALGLQALGDGMADAAVAHVMLGREKAPPPNYRARQMAAIEAAFTAAGQASLAASPTIGEIALACAIGYVGFRLPDMDWRGARPRLAAWYDEISAWPPMGATRPALP